MAEGAPPESSSPNLSQYFGPPKQSKLTSHAAVDLADEVDEAVAMVKRFKLRDGAGGDEPEVCRLFAAEASAKPSDPTASFFDFIGNAAGATGISADLELPPQDVRNNSCLIFIFCYQILPDKISLYKNHISDFHLKNKTL